MLSAWSDAQRFRLALLLWRGVQAATPLLLARQMQDAVFNRFAALLGAVQVMSGIMAFGQSQFSYAALHDRQPTKPLLGLDPPARSITTAWLVLCAVGLMLVPIGGGTVRGAQAAALAFAAYALACVELLSAQALVAQRHRAAARLLVVGSAGYAMALLPVALSGLPEALAWGGLAGLALLAMVWWPKTAPLNTMAPEQASAALAQRLRFGSTQTAILLLSGAVPLMLHNLLPQVGIDLKGSKYISLFGTVSGIAIFIVSSGVVTRSAEIAGQSLDEAHASIDRAIRAMAVSASPVLLMACAAEWFILGTVSPLLALACWCFSVAQMTVSHIRYVMFAHQILKLDLLANLLPFAVVGAGAAAWLGLVPGSRGPLVPVFILTALAVTSAVLYRFAIRWLSHRVRAPR